MIDPFAWQDTEAITDNTQIPRTVLRHIHNAKRSEYEHAGTVLFQSDVANCLIRRPILTLKGDDGFEAEYTQWKAQVAHLIVQTS